MADRFYGIAVGGQLPKDVTEDSSTTSAAIELRVADTAYTTKKHVLMALEGLVAYMQTKETSPIA
jgi:hypothetical protein